MAQMFLIGLALLNLILLVSGAPSSTSEEVTTTESANDTAPQDLYVIRTIIYEVGILTDGSNDTDDNSTDISHQVDLTFFDPKYNGTHIDLSNIPLPVQTNVSGVEVTGLAPTNLGFLAVPPSGETSLRNGSDVPISVPVIPNAVVAIRRNVSTTNPEKSEKLLDSLPDGVLGVDNPLRQNE